MTEKVGSASRWLNTEKINYLSVFLLCSSVYITPFVALFIAIYYARRVDYRTLSSSQSRLMYPYFFIGLNAIITSIYSFNPISVIATMGLVVPYLVYALYVENELTPSIGIHMLRLLVYLSLPMGLYSFYQKAFMPLVEGRVYSTFANANLYAFFLAMVLLITLGLFLESSSKNEKKAYVFITLVNLGALYLTGCRTVLVALVVSIVFLLLLMKRYQWAMIFLGICGLFVYSVTINPQLIPRYTVLDANIAQRELLWDIAWDAIRSEPFLGKGLLSYKYYAIQYNIIKTHAHNTLLNIWVEWGIIGLLLVIWVMIIIFRQGLWGLRHSPYRNYIAILLSCMVAAFIHGIADNPMMSIQTGMLFLMLTSMILVFARDYPHKPRPHNLIRHK